MDSIKVSIITPSFNQALFLEDCIRSVLSQSYPNIEYIIIDGGSSDGSLEIIKKYEDQLAYWISEPDKGQSEAINKGFRKATGDVIAWLNSDDMYFPDAVATAVRVFNQNPELTLFYGDCVFIDDSGCFLRYFTEVEDFNLDRLLNFSDFIMQPTTFFSRSQLIKVSFLDEGLEYTMDWDLWCKLARVGPVHYERKLIAANRDYRQTKTNTGGIRRLGEIQRLNSRHKTRSWPHALIGYTAAEINYQCSKNDWWVAKNLGKYLAFGLACFSPAAVLYARRHEKNKNLYGLKPHSFEIPRGYAEIHFPVVESIIIRLVFLKTDARDVLKVNGEVIPSDSISIVHDQSHEKLYKISIFIENRSITGELKSVSIEWIYFEKANLKDPIGPKIKFRSDQISEIDDLKYIFIK